MICFDWERVDNANLFNIVSYGADGNVVAEIYEGESVCWLYMRGEYLEHFVSIEGAKNIAELRLKKQGYVMIGSKFKVMV